MAAENGFQEGFNNWRRTLAGISSIDEKAKAFESAANEIGGYVGRGLARAEAADWLTDLATAHGLFREFADSDIEGIITDAIARGSVSESGEPLPQINGKVAPLRFMSKTDFVLGFKPPNYLIEGMLQRRFIYSLTGQTGHAKTALALLIAGLVGSSNPNATLGSHKVEKGRAVYFVGENPDDIRMRVIGADSQRRDDPTADQIWFIPGVFNIMEMFNALGNKLVQIGGADLIIVDTSAAYFLGADEISNVEMGRHARMLRRLTELPGAPCVLVLCHPIKYVTEPCQLLPRGGGAFLAEMDGNLTVFRHDDTLIELHHNKIRGPGFEPMTFRLDRITTAKLVDSKDRMIPTVAAVWTSRTEEGEQSRRSRDDEDRVLAALLANPTASLADLAEQAGWHTGSGEPAKSRVKKAVDRIHASSKPALLRKNRDRWELTDAGKEVARRAALDFEHKAAMASEAAKQSALF
jgi:AAA domain-containing protein